MGINKSVSIVRLAVASTMLMVSTHSWAGGCETGNAAQQMACLKMQNAVLSERLAQATLLKNISEQSTSDPSSRNLGTPSVISIYGVGQQLTAVLAWAAKGENEGTMIVHNGTHIPGGWLVKEIANGTVIVQKGPIIRTLLLSDGDLGHQLSIAGTPSAAGFNLGMSGNHGPMVTSRSMVTSGSMVPGMQGVQ
jgi:type IV pilus biogenesis protein PilP